MEATIENSEGEGLCDYCVIFLNLNLGRSINR